jgi:hypothetical protein
MIGNLKTSDSTIKIVDMIMAHKLEKTPIEYIPQTMQYSTMNKLFKIGGNRLTQAPSVK